MIYKGVKIGRIMGVLPTPKLRCDGCFTYPWANYIITNYFNTLLNNLRDERFKFVGTSRDYNVTSNVLPYYSLSYGGD